MTQKNHQASLWWMYLNNKKIQCPVSLDQVKIFCNQFQKLNFEMFEYLLIKGVCLKFPEGKIQLKPASNLDLQIENLIREAL